MQVACHWIDMVSLTPMIDTADCGERYKAMKSETAAELKLLRDTVTASLLTLSNLGRATDQWDDLLVYLIT